MLRPTVNWLKRLAYLLLAAPTACRWMAPFRTLRQVLGLIPARMPIAKAHSILVIRPDAIGDVVLTSPFLRELRLGAPDAHITILVKYACRELVDYCPYVDEVHTLPFKHAGTQWDHLRLRWSALLLRWRLLPWRGYDLVLLPRRGADMYHSEMVGHLLAGHGALLVHREMRIKNSRPPPPDPPVAFYAFSNPQVEHEVLHNLHFLAWCLGADSSDSHLEIWCSDADRAFARVYLSNALPYSSPLIVVHPSGGNSPLKHWANERFCTVVRYLTSEMACRVLIIGGADESWISTEFATAAADQSTALAVGDLTLRQLSAVLETASLFIGGDSGPMHIAAAAGIPVLAVFGPTSEVRFHPWGAKSHVVSLRYACSPDVLGTFEDRCRLCRFPEPLCLTELPTPLVISTVREILSTDRVLGVQQLSKR